VNTIRDAFIEYLRGLDEARLLLRAPATVLPFVVMGALEAVVLFALTWFTVAPFAGAMVPVVARIGGEEALHYPMHYILLPGLYGALYLPLVALVGFPIYGRAVFSMGDRIAPQRAGHDGFARYVPALIVVGIVYVAVAAGVPGLFVRLQAVAGKSLAGPVGLAGLVAAAAAQAILVYAPVCLWRKGGGPLGALRSAFSEGRRRFLPTFLLVLTVVLAHRPIEYMLERPDRLALKFRPELVFQLIAAGVVLEVVTSFFLFAATAGLAISRREDPFA
jgi:hypothetical protein